MWDMRIKAEKPSSLSPFPSSVITSLSTPVLSLSSHHPSQLSSSSLSVSPCGRFIAVASGSLSGSKNDASQNSSSLSASSSPNSIWIYDIRGGRRSMLAYAHSDTITATDWNPIRV
jgi:hypothetical protein